MKNVREVFQAIKDVLIHFCISRKYIKLEMYIALCLIFIFTTQSTQSQTITTAQSGPFNVGSTWTGGIVPTSTKNVVINHIVTLTTSENINKITIASGSLDVTSSSAALAVADSFKINGGTLNNSAGTVTVGPVNGGNKVLYLLSGSLNLASTGTLSVNGNVSMTGGTFTMTGGSLNVNPNNGTASTSVASGTAVFSITSTTTTTVTGGVITFLNPHKGTSGTFSYSATANADWSGNTMSFGGGSNQGGSTKGFNVDTRSGGTSSGYVLLGNVIVNGGTYNNKKAVTGSATAANGFDVGGDLTINSGCEMRTQKGGAILRIRGNIYNNGAYTDLSGISFGQRTGPVTTAQVLTGTGSFNDSTGAAFAGYAFFSYLEFNNTATPIGVKFIFPVPGDIFIKDSAAFTNGAVDVGRDNLFYFSLKATSSRVNGFLLRGGSATMAKAFPIGASSFTYHIADTTGTYDYSPVNIYFNSNDYNNRVVGVFVVDAVHPNMNDGDPQTDYISRYWRVTNTPLGHYNDSLTFGYIPSDVIGTESKIQTNLWTGLAWAQAYSNSDPIRHVLKIDKVTETTWPNDTLTLAHITGRVHRNTTYKWNKSGSSVYDWTTQANWTPLRTIVSSSDSLIFENITKAYIRNVRSSEVVSVVQLKNSNITLVPDTALYNSSLLEMVGGIGNVLDIQAGSTLVLKDSLKAGKEKTMSLGFRGAQNANISGTLTLMPSTKTTNNTYDGRNCLTYVDGTINNAGSVLAGSKDSLTIFGTYNHTFTTFGGTIPAFTWGDTTKCNIIGYTTFNGLQPLSMGSYLRKVTYNSPSQTNNVAFNGLPGTTIDTLVLASTGSTGTLSMSNGSVLILRGPINYTPASKFIADSGTIIMNGSLAQTFPSGFFSTKKLGSLTIDNNAGVSMTDTVKIIKTLTLTNGQLATANALILLSSSEDSTARVAQIASTANPPVSGNVTVERFIPAKRAYRFLSPSVTTINNIRTNWQENGSNNPGYGTHITGKTSAADGFDVTATNNASLYFYNNPTQHWDSITSTTGNLLYAGNAYRLFVRGDRTTNLASNNPPASATILRTYGTLKYGNVTYDKNGLNNTPPLKIADSAMNAIGNPYASSIDWEDILKLNSSFQITGTAADIYPSYTTYDSRLGNSTVGIAVSYNAASQTNSLSSSYVSRYIQPGQAFFVTTIKGGTNPYITFQESNKSSAITHVYRTSATRPKLSLLLTLDSNDKLENTVDGLVDVFDENFPLTIGVEDSYKVTNSRENIAIHRNGTDLCIEGRPLVTTNDSIPLKIWNYKQKSYYLKIACENFDPELKAFVKDAYLNTETPIRLDSITWFPLSITSDAASYAADRFKITFKAGEVLPVTLTNVNAYQKNKGIEVEWVAQSEAGVATYEVEKYNGQQFVTVTAVVAKGINGVTQAYNWFDANAIEGNNLYRIKVIDKAGEIKYSQVVRVNIGTLKSGFAVYPNPVKGNVIGVHLTNMRKGQYAIVLYNNAGQKVFTSSIEHIGGTGTYNVAASTLPKGNYKMVIDNGDSKLNENIIVE